MNPTTLLFLAAALACPIGMGLMMWWMSKSMSGQQSHSMPTNQTPAERLAALRTQRHALEAEIAETVHIAELEAKREALRAAPKPTPDEANNPAAQSAD